MSLEFAKPIPFQVPSGKITALMGRGGCGKTQALNGFAEQNESALLLDANLLPSRGKVKDLTSWFSKRKFSKWDLQVSRMDDALEAVGLEPYFETPVADLSPAMASAACLIPLFLTQRTVILVDMLMDWIDPVVFSNLFAEWKRRETIRPGATSLVVATHSPQVAEESGYWVTLSNQKLNFLGSQTEARARFAAETYEIRSAQTDALENFLQPFQLQIQKGPNELKFTADGNTPSAAELFQLGFGNIESIVTRTLSTAEIIRLMML